MTDTLFYRITFPSGRTAEFVPGEGWRSDDDVLRDNLNALYTPAALPLLIPNYGFQYDPHPAETVVRRAAKDLGAEFEQVGNPPPPDPDMVY
jgi:hypothetical protein